jgi:hypothetical protein
LDRRFQEPPDAKLKQVIGLRGKRKIIGKRQDEFDVFPGGFRRQNCEYLIVPTGGPVS